LRWDGDQTAAAELFLQCGPLVNRDKFGILFNTPRPGVASALHYREETTETSGLGKSEPWSRFVLLI